MGPHFPMSATDFFELNRIGPDELEVVVPAVPEASRARTLAAALSVADARRGGVRDLVLTFARAWSDAEGWCRAALAAAASRGAAANFWAAPADFRDRPWLAAAARDPRVRFVAEAAAPAEFFEPTVLAPLSAAVSSSAPDAFLFQLPVRAAWFPEGLGALVEGLGRHFGGGRAAPLSLYFPENSGVRYADVSAAIGALEGRLGPVRLDLLSGGGSHFPACCVGGAAWAVTAGVSAGGRPAAGFAKPAACARCSANAACAGVPAAYLAAYGPEELVPLG